MWPYDAQGYGTFPQSPWTPKMQMPPQQVTRVSGRPGAEAYNLGANSSALLLDESGMMVWAITTDGAGYKTIVPYDITPHQDAEAKSLSDIEARLTRLEGLIHAPEDPATT